MRAILVNVIPKTADKVRELRNFDELSHLVKTYGGIVVVKILQKRGRPSAKTFLGPGKAEEVAALAFEKNADLVIVNDFLKANQANNLRMLFDHAARDFASAARDYSQNLDHTATNRAAQNDKKTAEDQIAKNPNRTSRKTTPPPSIAVWDRFELILKIFEKHAHSQEAKLQVELTRLKYEFPKLFGKGAALSQQAGHLGVRGGGGEKLLEVQRQHLRQRITKIEKKLQALRKVHANQRAHRRRQNLPLIALIGYTNSGKTSLLQALTQKKNLYVANKLFATLENRISQLWLPNLKKTALLTDTIGFIRDLPPILFESFLSTLEEVQNADLLLHVIDASDPKRNQKIKIVQKILKELNCQNKPQIFVFNKIDLLPPSCHSCISCHSCKSRNLSNSKFLRRYSRFTPTLISAKQKTGLPKLIETIEKRLK